MKRIMVGGILSWLIALTGTALATQFIPATRSIYQPLFYALNHVLPVGDTITIDRTYVLPGVAAEYKYDLWIDGTHFATSTGAPLRGGIPESQLGWKARIYVSVRIDGSKDFVVAESLQTTIAPRAIFAMIPNSNLTLGEPLNMAVFQGVNPQLSLEPGTVLHVEDDQGGVFFNADVPVTGYKFVVPMRPGALVTAPTPITVRIASSIHGQLDDEQTVVVAPSRSPATVDPSLATLESVPLKDITYDRAVIGALSHDECIRLQQSIPSFARGLRTHVSDNPSATIGINAASCEAVWKNNEMTIARLFVRTYAGKRVQVTTFDKKTGETVARESVLESDVEDSELRGDALETALKSVATDGPFAGKTLNDALRASACLK